jgi:hypothetical protein
MCTVEEKKVKMKKYEVGLGDEVEHEETFCLMRSLIRFPYDHMSRAHRSRVCVHAAALYYWRDIDDCRSPESISRRARFMSESGICEYSILCQALWELRKRLVFTSILHKSSMLSLCS